MRSSKPDIIVVTGGAGYIGSVLVRRLLADGYQVRVIDSLLWGGGGLLELAGDSNLSIHNLDLCDAGALPPILRGCRAVVHLAAIAGEEACLAEPDLARRVNVQGAAQLYAAAERAGCSRFVYASSCSVYARSAAPGAADGGPNSTRAPNSIRTPSRSAAPGAVVDEQAAVAPASVYDETAIAGERLLLGSSSRGVCAPTILRMPSAYGASPRMRFDLPVHELVRDLWLERDAAASRCGVGRPDSWMACGHVKDLARAVCRVLESPDRAVGFEVFNVGDTSENYSRHMILAEIRARLASPVNLVPGWSAPGASAPPPGMKEPLHSTDEFFHGILQSSTGGQRVSCDKIRDRLGFHVTRRLTDGIAEILMLLSCGLISDPDDERYVNAPRSLTATG